MSNLKFVKPMQAKLVERPPAGDWIYEVKLDGFRTLALKEGRSLQLFSRNAKDFGERFPDIAQALESVRAKEAVIDGEIVALASDGRSSFQLLQAYDVGEARPPLYFYAFDLLRLNGQDLTGLPLAERKAQLLKVIKKSSERIRYSESLEGDFQNLFDQARALGLEGLIGKRKNSTYEIGRRSGAWIKLKLAFEQEMVIGGYSNPEGSRQYFGALLVGYYENGALRYVGKVGTGYTQATLAKVHRELSKIPAAKCPFANLPEPRGSRYSPGMTAAEMRKCHWVKPKLVAQIQFTEWTRDDKLRHPVFLGLRDDKPAREVVRERPA